MKLKQRKIFTFLCSYVMVVVLGVARSMTDSLLVLLAPPVQSPRSLTLIRTLARLIMKTVLCATGRHYSEASDKLAVNASLCGANGRNATLCEMTSNEERY